MPIPIPATLALCWWILERKISGDQDCVDLVDDTTLWDVHCDCSGIVEHDGNH
jgi:hypothetical protein